MYPASYGTYQTASGHSVTGYVYNNPMSGGLQTSNGQNVYRIN